MHIRIIHSLLRTDPPLPFSPAVTPHSRGRECQLRVAKIKSWCCCSLRLGSCRVRAAGQICRAVYDDTYYHTSLVGMIVIGSCC
jgi:hypothetical protein